MIKNADMRVWLYAPKAARAERVVGRDGMTFEAAEKHITERDDNNHLRYHEIYNINIYDHSPFDLVINTEHFIPGGVVGHYNSGRMRQDREVHVRLPHGKIPGRKENRKKENPCSEESGKESEEKS